MHISTDLVEVLFDTKIRRSVSVAGRNYLKESEGLDYLDAILSRMHRGDAKSVARGQAADFKNDPKPDSSNNRREPLAECT